MFCVKREIGLWSCVVQTRWHGSLLQQVCCDFNRLFKSSSAGCASQEFPHGDSCHNEAFTLLKYHHLHVYYEYYMMVVCGSVVKIGIKLRTRYGLLRLREDDVHFLTSC